MKRLISLDELRKKRVCQVKIDSKEIICVLRGNEVYAFDGFCPHQGGPLVKGQYTENDVRCPWHGCQFKLKGGLCIDTGSCKNLSKSDVWLNMHKCEIKNGEVYLDE